MRRRRSAEVPFSYAGAMSMRLGYDYGYRVRRTVDLCSRGEGRVVGECFGRVVVCAIDVSVFLGSH